jgi:hypothetical protein
MEVYIQLHARGNSPQYQFYIRLLGSQFSALDAIEKADILFHPRIEPRFLGHQGRSLVPIPTTVEAEVKFDREMLKEAIWKGARCEGEDNIKIYLKLGFEDVDWNLLVEDFIHLLDLVNTVMKCWVP